MPAKQVPRITPHTAAMAATSAFVRPVDEGDGYKKEKRYSFDLT